MAFTLNIADILADMRPGEKWAIRGNHLDYANLEWMDAAAKPTEAEMQTAELAAAKAWRKNKVKAEAKSRIVALWPEWKQRNASLGGYAGDYSATQPLTGATNASPIVITQTGHGWQTGDKVTISGVNGNSAANVTDNTITKVDSNSYGLNGTVGIGAYTGGGTAKRQMELGIKNDISKVRNDSNTAEADIDALSTVAAVISFTW
jgi:hypothetical protein